MSGKVPARRPAASMKEGPVSIKVFSADRICDIHGMLVAFFAASPDPIRNLGLRDASLLEQAVSHQFSGESGSANPLEKPAALLQGLVDELPFHDGNAQTAFISLLLLLDENGFVPNRVSFDAFFHFFAALYEHRLEAFLGERPSPSNRKARVAAAGSEFSLILSWLEAHTRQEESRDYPLDRTELERLLSGHGFRLQAVAAELGRALDVLPVGAAPKKRLFDFGGGGRGADPASVLRIQVPAEDGMVSLTSVRDIRKAAGLGTERFYDGRARIDSLIRQHLTLLARLGGL